MSCAQVGKTEIILTVIGFYVHYKPAPILVVQPTLQMGAYSVEYGHPFRAIRSECSDAVVCIVANLSLLSTLPCPCPLPQIGWLSFGEI